jgi:protein-tyrosine phosphatase
VTAAKGMDHVRFEAEIEHVVYPLLDAKTEDISSLFDEFYNLIETNIRKGSVLVHCSAGISRVSFVVSLEQYSSNFLPDET